mmetsp:Transcript_115452/g.337667  ORF Transcript_115452/g.337667 Transcript_115452/m.337667 type:complete len:408 (-) Transcript_115452:161-1384(-)
MEAIVQGRRRQPTVRPKILTAAPFATVFLVGRYLRSETGRNAFVGPPAPTGGRPAAEPPSRAAERPRSQRVRSGRRLEKEEGVVRKADTREEGVPTGTVAAVASGAGLSMAAAADKQKGEAIQTLVLGVTSALLFLAFVFYSRGAQPATEWLACYVIEYSLSIDNLFVFIIIFKYFKVPQKLQSNVLNLGILGAIVLRFVFVYLGAIVLQEFQFLILGFAAILLYASYSGFVKDDEDDDEDDNLDDNFIVQNLRKVLDVTPAFDGDKFITEVEGKTFITPLLLCLLTIEFSDIVFATDSVPAVLGTTQDQFVAYTSNVFAVFGLRALFFLLQEAMVSFAYLESAVNFVLGFIGLKIILDFFKIVEIDVLFSLAIVLGTLLVGVVLSINDMSAKTEANAADETEDKLS